MLLLSSECLQIRERKGFIKFVEIRMSEIIGSQPCKSIVRQRF